MKISRNQVMQLAEQAGIAPNTILHWEPAFLRFAELLETEIKTRPMITPKPGKVTAEHARAVMDEHRDVLRSLGGAMPSLVTTLLPPQETSNQYAARLLRNAAAAIESGPPVVPTGNMVTYTFDPVPDNPNAEIRITVDITMRRNLE